MSAIGQVPIAPAVTAPIPIGAISVSSLAALTLAQQDTIVRGTIVVTSTQTYVYTGAGSKTISASYINLIGDVLQLGGTIDTRNKVGTGGSINTSGDNDGATGGSINTSAYNGYNGGTIATNAANNSSGGSINTTGGDGGEGGNINTSGGGVGGGGFINTSNNGGHIDTRGGAGVIERTYQTGDPENPTETENSFPGGAGGSINMMGGTGGWPLEGGANGSPAGSIDLRGGNGSDGVGGAGGSILLKGNVDGAVAGSINLSGGNSVGNGGSIISTGANGENYNGGTLYMSAGSNGNGGSIDTSGGMSGVGGSINTRNRGGYIITSGNDEGGFGGYIDTRAIDESGGYINTSGNEATGGNIDTRGSSGGGRGGNINTSGGGENAGGNINTSGGSSNFGIGGSIDLSNGGGSINTRGVGSIQLGVTGTRTTLNGSASGSDKTITLPNATGRIALTSDVQTIFTLGGDEKTTFANGVLYAYGGQLTRGTKVLGNLLQTGLLIRGNWTLTGYTIHQNLPSACSANLTYNIINITGDSSVTTLTNGVNVAGNNGLTTYSANASVNINDGMRIAIALSTGTGTLPISTAVTTITAHLYCVPR